MVHQPRNHQDESPVQRPQYPGELAISYVLEIRRCCGASERSTSGSNLGMFHGVHNSSEENIQVPTSIFKLNIRWCKSWVSISSSVLRTGGFSLFGKQQDNLGNTMKNN
nr:hypothetical protein CFP56_23626 [Quercus suber]